MTECFELLRNYCVSYRRRAVSRVHEAHTNSLEEDADDGFLRQRLGRFCFAVRFNNISHTLSQELEREVLEVIKVTIGINLGNRDVIPQQLQNACFVP